MSYLFTSESVSSGHPDKICDQISDAILDAHLKCDPNARVACETLVTTGLVVCAGEITSKGSVSVDDVVRKTIENIGYTKSEYGFDSKSCGIVSSIHTQSPDIAQGVLNGKGFDMQGAGDQGIMFGYACNETDNYMPITAELSNTIMRCLELERKNHNNMPYLRPDAKCQVTMQYSDDGIPEKIDTILISVQHDEFDGNDEVMQKQIKDDLLDYVIRWTKEQSSKNIQDLLNRNDWKFIVNPTGRFVIGGPAGDTGLTGRKIVVDTYGGHCAHGGGAFSGKDSSKVDRSAAYAARHIAKNVVAAGLCDKILVQISYAIGIAKPVSFYVNTYGTLKLDMTDGEFANELAKIFPLMPYDIVKRFGLKNPIFEETATYGHFGRPSYTKEVEVFYNDAYTWYDEASGKTVKEVTFFGWEKLDYVDTLRNVFRCTNCRFLKNNGCADGCDTPDPYTDYFGHEYVCNKFKPFEK